MKKLVLFCCLCAFYSPAMAQEKEFAWLIGTWQEGGKKSFEVWKQDGTSLHAVSFKINDKGEKVASEEIRLIKKSGAFYFIPDIAGDQGPIEFKISSFDKNSFVAENPSHDFPKKIIYKLTDQNHLQVFIQDDHKSIPFYFKKTE